MGEVKNPIAGVWLGKVVKLEDEPPGKRVGKLKVSIPDLYGENISPDDLPWSFPLFSGYVSPDEKALAFFAMPPVNARVGVLFERGDPQAPRWFGGWSQTGRLPFQAYYSEGDKWPNIELWRAEDGMMIRFVKGERLEINLGKSGTYNEDGTFVPDGEHNEYDTYIRLDKKRRKVTFRSKYQIEVQCKAKIKVKATGIQVRVMPNQVLADDGETWQNAPGSVEPRYELSVFDPEAEMGAQIRSTPGKLQARSRSVKGFANR